MPPEPVLTQRESVIRGEDQKRVVGKAGIVEAPYHGADQIVDHAALGKIVA